MFFVRIFIFKPAALTLLILLGFSLAVAGQDDTCQPLAALADCGTVSRESICINGESSALFGDINLNQDEAALLNISANYPLSIGEQGVLFLVLGDVQLANAVPDSQRFTPVEAVTVTPTTSTNLRSRPSTDDTVLASVNPGVSLPADGISDDGEWLRVAYDGNPAWVYRSLVTGTGIDTLPTIGADARTRMQDFTLITGGPESDESGCGDSLILQALEQQPARLRVNGADIAVLSTVALRASERPFTDFAGDATWRSRYPGLLPDDGIAPDAICRFTQLYALDGEAFLNGGRLSVPRGFQALAFDCGESGVTTWTRVEAMNPVDLAGFAALETLPDGLLRAPVTLATMQEIVGLLSQISRPTVTNVEQTASSPAADDAEAPPRIRTSAECPGFVPTHPLTGVAFGFVRFYWDPAPGATSYRVNLYNYQGDFVIGFNTAGPETSVRVDTMSPLFTYPQTRTPPLSYEVVAYQDGAVLCTTPLLTLIRDYDPDPDCPAHMWFTGECEDYVANEP